MIPIKGGYPAKLKKVLIVTAPLWFKAPFRILRLFVREKLRERVHTVNAPQLGLHVPRSSLPKQLGGLHEPDHAAWLEHCKNCYTNNLQNAKLDGVIDEYVISNHIPPINAQNGIIEHEGDMTSDRATRLGDSNTDMHISGDPPYTCDPSPLRLPSNLAKNRYTDVLCYDHSRVILSQTDPDDPTTDYINANYVDGYKQKNAYICTQGPLPKTFSDFWRMVWEQGTLVIVMTTRAVERGRVKCGQYWPLADGQHVVYGDFAVTTQAVEHDEDYTRGGSRRIWHGQYTRWPDYGVPGGGSAQPVLRFLARCRRAQALALHDLDLAWAGHKQGPPIVRVSAEGALDVRGTVERIRAQRAHSIQMPDQYVFCHLALLEYAVMQGYLDSADLTGFDEDNEEESE
ncbi:hypothetical protein HF086_009920 [Spodoptera exigua]|uniref:Tyrosine-protein phosphatase domain-containing protein n=1 Tax=Spodoptera exigua TaxID=7107 RepID=A0A922SAD8_SPOEX|nr:hypothetical protein HF086_009920 [Spodoptera exigua]